jgi:hypothetical protein
MPPEPGISKEFSMATQFSATSSNHNHGIIKIGAKMRCGVIEGLSVKNSNNNKVSYLFTDGLRTCAQTVFWNDTATFTCHLKEGDEVTYWLNWARKEFVSEYGNITACYVIVSEKADTLTQTLAALDGLNPKVAVGWHGGIVEVKSGALIKFPDSSAGWHAGEQDVIGWYTARELIDIHFTGKRTLGSTMVGDYSDFCPVCQKL